jgi:hypothetical protein
VRGYKYRNRALKVGGLSKIETVKYTGIGFSEWKESRKY